MAHLTVMTTEDGDALRVIARGQLDLSTAERLEEALRQAEARGPATLLLDYSSLDFIDSTGLQVLLDADVRASADGRRLVVRLGTGEAHRVVALADAARRLQVAEIDS